MEVLVTPENKELEAFLGIENNAILSDGIKPSEIVLEAKPPVRLGESSMEADELAALSAIAEERSLGTKNVMGEMVKPLAPIEEKSSEAKIISNIIDYGDSIITESKEERLEEKEIEPVVIKGRVNDRVLNEGDLRELLRKADVPIDEINNLLKDDIKIDALVDKIKAINQNSPEVSRIKAEVKLEERSKAEKRIKKLFNLSDEETKGKRLEDIIELASSKAMSSTPSVAKAQADAIGDAQETVELPKVQDLDKSSHSEAIKGQFGEAKKSIEEKEEVVVDANIDTEKKTINLSNNKDAILLKLEEEYKNKVATLAEELAKSNSKVTEYNSKLQDLTNKLASVSTEKEQEKKKIVNEYESFKENMIVRQMDSLFEKTIKKFDTILSDESIENVVLPVIKADIKKNYKIKPEDKNNIKLYKRDADIPDYINLDEYVVSFLRKNKMLIENKANLQKNPKKETMFVHTKVDYGTDAPKGMQGWDAATKKLREHNGL